MGGNIHALLLKKCVKMGGNIHALLLKKGA